MTGIADLLVEHRQLEKQAARLIEVVRMEMADSAMVAGERWRMAQLLFDHCGHEDRVVYDRLLASGDAAATADAWAFRQEHGGLSAMFAQFIAEWPVDRIAREWLYFRAETESVVASLAARIAHEESILFAHVERVLIRRAA